MVEFRMLEVKQVIILMVKIIDIIKNHRNIAM